MPKNVSKKRTWYQAQRQKKEPKPKPFGPDIFQTGGRGLARERVGAKKFDMSLKTREVKLFGRGIPGLCRDIPGVPEKFETERFVFNFRSLVPGPKARLRQGTFEKPRLMPDVALIPRNYSCKR